MDIGQDLPKVEIPENGSRLGERIDNPSVRQPPESLGTFLAHLLVGKHNSRRPSFEGAAFDAAFEAPGLVTDPHVSDAAAVGTPECPTEGAAGLGLCKLAWFLAARSHHGSPRA